jgi:hypothetical protein
MYLIGMLVLLFLANVAMLMGMTNWPQRTREGFAAHMVRSGVRREGMDNIAPYTGLKWAGGSLQQGAEFRIGSNPTTVHESFASPMLSGAGAVRKMKAEPFMNDMENGFATEPIGSYDGINMAANLPADAQGYRARMPNVPHKYGKFGRKASEMLPFEENECKPECCGSTMSCDGGGCVCTTPEDRDLINTRGGNRRHEDGF